MSVLPRLVSRLRNLAGVFRCNWFRKIFLDVFRFFEFLHSQGHSRPNWTALATSGLSPIAIVARTSEMGRFVPVSEIADRVTLISFLFES